MDRPTYGCALRELQAVQQGWVSQATRTFQEIMAWSLSGFPLGPLPVYVPFSIMETANTASIMASSAIIQNMPSPTGLASVSSKIQEPMAPGSWIQVQLPNDC